MFGGENQQITLHLQTCKPAKAGLQVSRAILSVLPGQMNQFCIIMQLYYCHISVINVHYVADLFVVICKLWWTGFLLSRTTILIARFTSTLLCTKKCVHMLYFAFSSCWYSFSCLIYLPLFSHPTHFLLSVLL